MAPLVEYLCGGTTPHRWETLYLSEQPSPHLPEHCPTCGAEAERVISAPRLKADGTYSYRPQGSSE